MSIVVITGSHPRHTYLVSALQSAGILSGCIIEEREAFVPQVPGGLTSHLSQLFRTHFTKREAAEHRFFDDALTPDIPTITVTRDSLNSQKTSAFLSLMSPKLVISYGCHKLSAELMSSVDALFWNIHGGLSPQYRGVITHFWPSYMLEPQMTGMTLHETSNKIDGGRIIHQTKAPLIAADGLHELASRTVKQCFDDLPELLKTALQSGPLPSGISQKTSGKIWISDDWRPEHLPLIYDQYDDQIVARLLDGTLTGREPECISLFNASCT